MHEFGVAVSPLRQGGGGLLCWKTQVWHFEASTKVDLTKEKFDWSSVKGDTRLSDVFRVYCGVLSYDPDKPMYTANGKSMNRVDRDHLIRHAFFSRTQLAYGSICSH